MLELQLDGACRFCRRNIFVEASENMSLPALSLEERAERAIRAHATAVPDIYERGFKAGYLAHDKEKS